MRFCLQRGVRGVQERGNSHTTRLRLVTRSTRKNLRATSHAGKRCRDLEMARWRRSALFRVRRRAPHGQGCRCCATQNCARTWRQKRRRSEQIRRKAQERQTLQARRLLNDEARMSNDELMTNEL